MKYWFSILIILFIIFSTFELRAEIPDYDEMIEKLESYKEDTLRYENVKGALCFYYPESEKVYEFANEEFYDKMYPIWRNDSLKVIEINKLLEKYPKTNWRRTMYQYLTYSLHNLNRKIPLVLVLVAFREAFPNDYKPFSQSARYYNELDNDPHKTLEFAIKAHAMSYNYPKMEFFPDEEWLLEKRSAPVKTVALLAEIYFKQSKYAEAEEMLNNIISNNDLGLDDETTLCRCYYWLAKIHEEEGNREEAVQSAIKALVAGDSRNYYTPKADSLLRREIGYKDLSEAEYSDFIRKQVGYDEVVFSDVTSEIGMENVRAGRIAWGDYNNDGFQDILLDGKRLFRNMKGVHFVEITQSAFPDTIRGNGGLWGDFDNDGDLDVITKDPETVWLNDLGTFYKVDGTNSIQDNQVSTEGVGIGDVNKDGFLDVYFANYEKNYVNEEDQLFRGIGEGKFLEITEKADILPTDGKNRAGRGVNMCDFDLDGDLDIFVSNYRLTDNFLWQNDGTGHFENNALKLGIAGDEVAGWWGHTIGSEWADVDNDGDFDLITCNLAHPRYIDFSNKTRLYINENEKFIDRRKEAGIKFEETHSEPCWADFNNDGFMDLYITSIYEGRRSFLYMNNGDGTFKETTFLAGVRHFNGWGAACADYDNDGDVDLLVAGGKIQLFRNEANKKANWLEVRVIGKNHVDAIGTRLILSNDEISLMHEIQGGKGTTNQHSLIQHFGLGTLQPPFKLDVIFPSGIKKMLMINEINKIMAVKE
ncbi:MAG: FG-GAP-like repeat-containing protein [Candidatus Cloacimonadota bacterium]|nr:FG-GAP-like repeat-containing protein [Candidatus Cloacimonadota bacterium]